MEIKAVDVKVRNGALFVPNGLKAIPFSLKPSSFDKVDITLVKSMFALKLIKNVGPETEAQFLKEIEAIEKVKTQPNFVKYHSFGKIENKEVLDFLNCSQYERLYFILMENVGFALEEWIKTMKTEDDARVVFHQICDRVLRMNVLGLINRNLTLSNVRYTVLKDNEENEFKVIKTLGFNLIKDPNSTLEDSVYTAPEVREHKGSDEHKLADIWSLGIILLEILIKMHGGNIEKYITPNFYDDVPKFLDSIDCVPWAKFPNCRELLSKLIARKESRITIDDLKEYPWLLLNVDDIVCEHFKKKYNPLGKGGFGSVCKGIDLETGEEVSVKRMAKPSCYTQELFEKYSEAEINNLEKLKGQHPNIVDILGYERVEEIQYGYPEVVYYVVTELCDGSWDEDLSGIERIPKECIQQMCNALAYMNVVKKMVHRDVKPENIMYVVRDGKKEVRIIDFGLSKGRSIARTVCGSYDYRAPELESTSTATHVDKVDIYSLGATFSYYKYFDLLPVDFPVECIKRMIERDYKERMSWDELIKIEYFGFLDDNGNRKLYNRK